MAAFAPSQTGAESPSLKRTLSEDTQVETLATSEAPDEPGWRPYQKFSPGYLPAIGSAPQLLLQPWDPQLLQITLRTQHSFSSASSIGVLRATSTATNWWPSLSYTELSEKVLGPAATQEQPEHPECRRPHTLILLVVYLEYNAKAQYQRQASISQQDFESLVRRIEMHDAAVQDLLGRPDYWSAFGRRKDIGSRRGAGYEFFCQHPRWLQKSPHHKAQHRAPCSIYLHHDGTTNTSTYVMAAARHDGFVEDILQRMGIPDEESSHQGPVVEAAADPFLIHVLVSGIAYQQSIDYIADLRRRLFDEISEVNDYSKESYMSSDQHTSAGRRDHDGRKKLEAITKNLHMVSQTCDSGIANVEMSIKLCEEMVQAYEEFSGLDVERPPESWQQVHDSMKWILKTWRCQRNWLVSYRARKDTTINFVYSLVTQQDNSVNIDIAHQAAQHGSSMNVITILTMVFLPGTFVAGIFGSGIVDQQTHGLSDLFWPFVWVFIPLTILTMAFWLWRVPLGIFFALFGRKFKLWLAMLRRKPRPLDMEKGQ